MYGLAMIRESFILYSHNDNMTNCFFNNKIWKIVYNI